MLKDGKFYHRVLQAPSRASAVKKGNLWTAGVIMCYCKGDISMIKMNGCTIGKVSSRTTIATVPALKYAPISEVTYLVGIANTAYGIWGITYDGDIWVENRTIGGNCYSALTFIGRD